MATCIEKGVRLQMKISCDWTVKKYKKSNFENERKLFFKNEVLQFKPHKICGCYNNLTVMWLTEKYYQSKKKWVIVIQVKENCMTKKSTRARVSAAPGGKGEPPCSQDGTKALHTDNTVPHTCSRETTQQVTTPIHSAVIIVNLGEYRLISLSQFSRIHFHRTPPSFEQA